MTKSSLAKLTIRTGVVRQPDLGYLLACDPKKEEQGIAHTSFFKWKAGAVSEGTLSFDAHSICDVHVPHIGLVMVGSQGHYCITSKGTTVFDNIFGNSAPAPSKPRYGDIRSVSAIGGKAYTVGFGGAVYRLDDFARWTRIDDGIADTFDIEALDGFDGTNLYAVGFRGEIWMFNGRRWMSHTTPTNATLTCVKCGGSKVYSAGHRGTLLEGNSSNWRIVEHELTIDDFWDLEYFEGELYASTMKNLYRLKKNTLELVDFGGDKPRSFHHLSATRGILWSVGQSDVMAFDGRRWTRII